MLRHQVTIDGDVCDIFTYQGTKDLSEVTNWLDRYGARALASDTEATGLDPYEKDWELRLFQFGDRQTAFNIPAREMGLIEWICSKPRPWIMHNAPHDCLAVDTHLKKSMGMLENTVDTSLLSRRVDSRSRFDGGVGHRLKEDLAVHYVDETAADGERALKAAFKEISLPTGQFYTTGAKKGQPKMKKIKLQEGWRYIDLFDDRYLTYSGTDPLLTYRVWQVLRSHPHVLEPIEVDGVWMSATEYEHALQLFMDGRSRKGMMIDADYTQKLSDSYTREIELGMVELQAMGLTNPNAPKQVVAALRAAGAHLTKKTKTGGLSADKDVLRDLTNAGGPAGELASKIRTVKQMSKRKKSYADAMLRIRDSDDRIHASINTHAARTSRMSVSKPPFQQLPSTKAD